MWPLLLPLASAAPVLVKVQDVARGVQPPAEVQLCAATCASPAPLRDDGRPPDPRAADRLYSGLANPPAGAPPWEVTLHDAAGQVWRGRHSPEGEAFPELNLRTGAGGVLDSPEAGTRSPVSLSVEHPPPPAPTRWGLVLGGAAALGLGLVGLGWVSRRR